MVDWNQEDVFPRHLVFIFSLTGYNSKVFNPVSNICHFQHLSWSLKNKTTEGSCIVLFQDPKTLRKKFISFFLEFDLTRGVHKWWEEQRDACAHSWQKKWDDPQLYQNKTCQWIKLKEVWINLYVIRLWSCILGWIFQFSSQWKGCF